MKQYKYFYKVTDENGQIIFNHRSDLHTVFWRLRTRKAATATAVCLPHGTSARLSTTSPKTCGSVCRFTAIEFETEGTTDDERRGNH